MFSVALIGPDGAGKTTLTARLRESATIPVKCLYMGINIEASNHALPTSRLVAYFKRRQNKESGVYRCVDDSAPVRGNAKRGLSGWLWATGRLINRLLEEWYRRLLSWGYQMSGYAVVYDRHFLYDFTLDGIDDHISRSIWMRRQRCSSPARAKRRWKNWSAAVRLSFNLDTGRRTSSRSTLPAPSMLFTPKSAG